MGSQAKISAQLSCVLKNKIKNYLCVFCLEEGVKAMHFFLFNYYKLQKFRMHRLQSHGHIYICIGLIGYLSNMNILVKNLVVQLTHFDVFN